MGKYTVLSDPQVDRQIEKQINGIVNFLVKNFPNIQSIILTGGFGKGEGSVRISDGIVTPLRDFDFIAVFEKYVPLRHFVNITKQLDLCRSETLYDYKYYREFSIDLHHTTLDRLNLYPDIVTYDSKKSHIVYGADVRSKIKWGAKDIPLRSGARLLFQKSTALVGALPYKYILKRTFPKNLVNIFLRETSKVYVEIGAALCILKNVYDPHALKRIDILKALYKERFPELYEVIPNLVEKIEVSTKYKVDPMCNLINEDPIDYWFETRNDLGEAMKYYFDEYLHLSFSNWITYSLLLERKLMKEYYLPLLENYLKSRNLPKNKYLLIFLNFLYNLKENCDLLLHSFRDCNFSILSRISAPIIKLFSVCPVILFGVSQDGIINSSYIDEALRRLEFVRLNKKGINPWEKARLICLKLINQIDFL